MRRNYLIILWVLAASLVGCATNNKAPMATLTPIRRTLAVKQVWRVSAGGGTDHHYLTLTPSVANHVVYTTSYRGAITAINAKTGQRIWQIDTRSPLTSGISANHGLLYFGTGFGWLYCANQSNGHLAWKTPMPSEMLSTPTVAQHTVLVKTQDGALLALNSKTGLNIWSYQQTMPSLILRASSSVQVSQGLVAGGFANGMLAVMSLSNGQLVWQTQVAQAHGDSIIQRMVDIDATPKVRGGVVYVATYQGRIAAYQLRSGHLIWRHQLSSFTGLVLDATKVYVTDADSHVWAFNRSTGKLQWKQAHLSGRGLTAPALLGQTLIVADREGYVHWLSTRDGHFIARMRADKSGFIATPVVEGRNVYLYSNNGHLVKYRVG